jgi:hypothetical protein
MANNTALHPISRSLYYTHKNFSTMTLMEVVSVYHKFVFVEIGNLGRICHWSIGMDIIPLKRNKLKSFSNEEIDDNNCDN